MPTFLIPSLRPGTLTVITHIVSPIYSPSKLALITRLLACSTDVNVTISFGGRSWDVSSADFAMTKASSTRCIGAFFVLGSSNPAWIIGDTFLVRISSSSPKIVSHRHSLL